MFDRPHRELWADVVYGVGWCELVASGTYDYWVLEVGLLGD